jgi:hypothetical protein
MEMNKANDNDWFRISGGADGTKWKGKCWYVYNLLKYEFDLQFDIPVTYPATAPEIELPELDGKTAKVIGGSPFFSVFGHFNQVILLPLSGSKSNCLLKSIEGGT